MWGVLRMIVAVSDIHLGYDKSNKEDFLNFLEKNKKREIDHFVILGDLFDFWRENNAKIIMDNDDVLAKLDELNTNIHYIAGNHDYYILNLNERYENYPFDVSKSLRLKDNGNKFYFTHGYELEVLLNFEPMTLEDYEKFSEKMCFSEDRVKETASNLWGFLEENREIFNNLWDKIKKTPPEREKMDKIRDFALTHGKNLILGMKTDETLIFGHTHKPFINREKKVANTGSWVDELPRSGQNSYIEISDGQMELKSFGFI